MSVLSGIMARDKTINDNEGLGSSGKGLEEEEKSNALFEESDDDDRSVEGTENEDAKDAGDFVVSPLLPLKDQLNKDNEDESLRRWKEQLLAGVDINSIGERLEPDVKFTSLSILTSGRPELVLPIPFATNARGHAFTLKEGSRYSLKVAFTVHDNIVSGLKYCNTVWKSGVRVDRNRVMLGTFSPQRDPYTFVMEEETTPSGLLARGSYTAKTKFLDDDKRCYLKMKYTFEIRRDW